MALAARVVRDESEPAGQDPFDVVADGVARLRVQGNLIRAKALGRAHAQEVGPRLPDATVGAPPGLLRSAARACARERVAEVLHEVLLGAGVSSGDVAAACDLSARRVEEMRAGARPVPCEAVLLAAERLPAFREALLALLRERLEAQR